MVLFATLSDSHWLKHGSHSVYLGNIGFHSEHLNTLLISTLITSRQKEGDEKHLVYWCSIVSLQETLQCQCPCVTTGLHRWSPSWWSKLGGVKQGGLVSPSAVQGQSPGGDLEDELSISWSLFVYEGINFCHGPKVFFHFFWVFAIQWNGKTFPISVFCSYYGQQGFS